MNRRVRDVMTRTVVSVEESVPAKEVARLLDDSGVSAVPVVAVDGRLVGIVSDVDLLRLQAEEPHEIRQLEGEGALLAGDLMTSPVVTVEPDSTLRETARIMCERDVTRLPVVDDRGALVGIVSRSDLLRVLLRPDEEILADVLHDVVDRVLRMHAPSVRVTVREGTVRLEGTVERRSLILVLAGLVHTVDGVADVDVRLDYGVDDLEFWPEAFSIFGGGEPDRSAPSGLPRPS